METIKLDKEKAYWILSMNRPKVNAINQTMVDEMRDAVKAADSDASCRGVILTGENGIFSAGLDLPELFHYSESDMDAFFQAFAALHYELVLFSKPLVMAVNGHSPAGGTVIFLAGDHRVMAEGDKYGIGLNEVSVNVQISEMLIESYAFWLGKGRAYSHILSGDLLTPSLALKEGLVDQVVPKEEVLDTAIKKIKKYLQADDSILANTKKKLRKEWIAAIDKCDHNTDLAQAKEIWWNPEVRMKMQMYIHMITTKNN